MIALFDLAHFNLIFFFRFQKYMLQCMAVLKGVVVRSLFLVHLCNLITFASDFDCLLIYSGLLKFDTLFGQFSIHINFIGNFWL